MEPDKLYDVCIVGGGVAGASLAAYLGKSQLRVVVIEKNLSEQDRIVGELLQPGGVQMLANMDLLKALEDCDAQPVEGYALFMEGRGFQIEYPTQNGKKCTGRGMRNGKFVQQLRALMSAQQNVTVIEGTVKELLEHNGKIEGVSYVGKGSDDAIGLRARLTVVCDGIFSAFRQALSVPDKQVSGYFLGMILRNCELPYPHHGHVIIAEPSPVLVYPVTSSETRMLIDFPGDQVPKKGEGLVQYLLHVVGPQLPTELVPAFRAAVQEGKFKTMPNHRMAANPNKKHGAVLVGDSLNMRHPLTGGGMTVAFSDVYLLGSLLMDIKDVADNGQWKQAVETFYSTRNTQTATINILADALYGVMRSKDLKKACFNYLRQGGRYAEEPVAILSAVSRDAGLLIRHFFAVALFGVKQLLVRQRPLSAANRSFHLLTDSISIIAPLLRNERMLSLPKVAALLL